MIATPERPNRAASRCAGLCATNPWIWYAASSRPSAAETGACAAAGKLSRPPGARERSRTRRELGEQTMTRRDSSSASYTRSVGRQSYRRQHADGHEQRQKKTAVRDWQPRT